MRRCRCLCLPNSLHGLVPRLALPCPRQLLSCTPHAVPIATLQIRERMANAVAEEAGMRQRLEGLLQQKVGGGSAVGLSGRAPA